MATPDFKQVSLSVWERMAAGWDARHAFFEETARPVTERMLEQLDPRPGQRILEVAAGSGSVGLAVAKAVAEVLLSDFSPAMVAAAGRHAAELGLANVTCRVLDAEALDLPDESVDGVACRWGYMLMGDPVGAMRESRRVLRAGGRLTLAVFGGPDRNPWVAVPMAVLRERGHVPPIEANAPGILALADEDRLRAMIEAAGFEDIAIDRVTFTWHHSGFDDYWGFLNDAAGALAMVLGRLDAAERDAVREDLVARLRPDGPLGLSAECFVASAA